MGSNKRKRRNDETAVKSKRARVDQVAPDTMAKFQQLVSDADAPTMLAMIEKLQQALKASALTSPSTIFVAATNDNDDVETESYDNDPLESAEVNDERDGIDDNDEDDAIDDDECASDSGIDVDATTTATTATKVEGGGDDDRKVIKHSNARPDWFLVTTFTNAEEYDAYIRHEQFSAHKTVTTKKVINRYMRCKLVKKNGPQCRARLCVRMSKKEITWLVFTNGHDHTHEQIKNKLAPAKRGKSIQFKQERNVSARASPIGTRESVARTPNSNPAFGAAALERIESKGGTLSVVRKTHLNYVGNPFKWFYIFPLFRLNK